MENDLYVMFKHTRTIYFISIHSVSYFTVYLVIYFFLKTTVPKLLASLSIFVYKIKQSEIVYSEINKLKVKWYCQTIVCHSITSCFTRVYEWGNKQNPFVNYQHGKSQRTVKSEDTDGNCPEMGTKTYINN